MPKADSIKFTTPSCIFLLPNNRISLNYRLNMNKARSYQNWWKYNYMLDMYRIVSKHKQKTSFVLEMVMLSPIWIIYSSFYKYLVARRHSTVGLRLSQVLGQKVTIRHLHTWRSRLIFCLTLLIASSLFSLQLATIGTNSLSWLPMTVQYPVHSPVYVNGVIE